MEALTALVSISRPGLRVQHERSIKEAVKRDNFLEALACGLEAFFLCTTARLKSKPIEHSRCPVSITVIVVEQVYRAQALSASVDCP